MSHIFFGNSLGLPPASDISMYINLGVGVLLVLAFLFGYIKGMFKSSYQLITKLIVIIAFYLLAPTVTNVLLEYDLSSLGFTFDNPEITTLGGLIEDTLINTLNVTLEEGVLITDTLLYNTVVSVINVVVTIVLLLAAIILNLTVFKLFFWIIYLFIKPRKKDANGKKIKKKFLSRLGGGLVNTLSCVLGLLILFVPLSAVLSLGDTASQIIESNNTNTPVLVSYNGTNIKISSDSKSLLDSLGLSEEVLEIAEEYGSLYRDTIPGKIYSIKISGSEVDTFIFDKIFEINNGESTFSIRRELNSVLEVVGILNDAVEVSMTEDGGFDIFTTIQSLSEEEIESIFGKLSELEIIRFVVPVALETAEISVKYGNTEEGEDASVIAQTDLLSLIEVLKDTDYKKLITDIGGIVSDVKSLYESANVSLEEGFNMDILLNLDETKLQNVLNSVAELTIIDELYKVIISSYQETVDGALETYMVLKPNIEIIEGYYYINGANTNIAIVSELIEDIDVKINDEMKWVIVDLLSENEEFVTEIDATDSYFEISLNDIVITEEIKNLGAIYSSFKKLGVTSIDSFRKIFDSSIEAADIDYTKFTYENLNSISTALLNSKVISKASGNVMVIVNNMLPNEYRNMVVVPENVTPQDLTSILVLGKVVLESGLVSSGETIDYASIITNYKTELVDALKGSNLITSNLTPIVGTLLATVLGPDVITIPEQLNWGEELTALFDSVELLLQTGVGTEEFDLAKVESDDLALALSKSVIITKSMNNIIKFLLESVDLGGITIKTRDDIVWNYDEIHGVIKSAIIVLDMFMTEEGEESADFTAKLSELTDEEIQTLISSKFISSVFVNMLYDMAQEGGQLYDVLIVETDPNNDEYWLGTNGELHKLLSGIKLLISGVDLNDSENLANNLINKIVKLSNNVNPGEGETDEIGDLLASDVLTDTIVHQLLLNAEGNETLIVNLEAGDPRWLDSGEAGNKTPGEIRSIFKAMNLVLVDETGNVNLNSENFTDDLINRIVKLSNNVNPGVGETDQVGELLESIVITDTIINQLIANGESNPDLVVNLEAGDPRWVDSGEAGSKTPGEIRSIFKAMNLVLVDEEGNVDLNSENFTDDLINRVVKLTNNINPGVGETDQVGELLESIVIKDTIINQMIVNGESNPDLVVNLEADDPRWLDSGEAGSKTPGEIRSLFSAIDITLADEEGNVDLNAEIDLGKLINLTDEEQDKVLSSIIIVDSATYKLKEMSSDELSVLVVVEEHVTDWKAELKTLLSSAKIVLLPDAEGNYNLNDTNVDMDKVYNLTDDEIDLLLTSEIMIDTIAISILDANALATDKVRNEIYAAAYDERGIEIDIEDWKALLDIKTERSVLTSDDIWRDSDDGTIPGEVRKLLSSTGELMVDGSFNVDNLLTADTDLVFDSRVILDTFYYELHNLANGDLNGIILIKEGTVEDKEEAVNFMASIKVVIYKDKDPETVTITNLKAEDFEMDIFVKLNDTEIETFVKSNIMKYSGANQAYDILGNGGSLSSYVLLKGDTESDKIAEIEPDLGNLIKVLRDLKENNIDYKNGFDFNTFETALNANGTGEEERNAKADEIAEIILQSAILTQSLNKMFGEVLSGELTSEQMQDVYGEGNSELNISQNEWRGNGVDDIGELKRLLRIFTSVKQFSESTANNSDITDAEEITKPLKGINHSLVLHGLLPSFMDTALDNVKTWKSGIEPSGVEAWDKEIDAIGGLVAKVNALGTSLGSLKVYGEGAVSPADLGEVLRYINKSVILDINNIKTPLASGVQQAFGLGTAPAIGDVSLIDEYGDPIPEEEAWDAEITKLEIVITKLQAIEEGNLDLSDEDNARAIGEFLDACEDSQLLEPVIDDVLTKVLGDLIAVGPVQTILANTETYPDYASKFVAISVYVNSLS